ncbi:ATP-binding protein [Streptomyces cyaneofuscatus]|uniref:ATP-binding protein n=1 Tax=Streptomyces cyaneofuscatus TaxID=66883 RepID=A0ABZ1F2R9_9ACTN|nr:ATP-binding protein [Streptomyces cyaneofuscatus]WSB10513.1 ATP-binding protein [Streptomyces cyaneofuscatus]WSD45953.1 ATP-binding protein [Streptomyces cyaneofuscatus]
MTVTERAPGLPAMVDVEVLWERLARVEERVRHAVAARRAADPEPDDPYRGQYLTPDAVERILKSRDAFAPVPSYGAEPPSYVTEPPSHVTEPGSRLVGLVRSFGLVELDVELLLVAMAPDIDARFERLYGYLNDDLTRRRPAVGLALELCGLPAAGSGRFRFQPSAPLVAGGLLEIGDPERPLLSRTLRVPDRVTAHLLGDDEPDGRLRGLVRVPAPGSTVRNDLVHDDSTRDDDRPEVHRIAAALATGSGLVHLIDRGGDPSGLAVDALTAAGRRPLVVDIAALAAAGDRAAELVRTLAAEARLAHGGVVLGPLEVLAPERPEGARLLASLCAAVSGTPLIAYGKKNWDPLWTRDSPVPVAVLPPGPAGAARRWRQALAEAARSVGLPDGQAPADDDRLIEATASYRLDSDQLRKAATVAARLAAQERRPVHPDDLRTAVRAQNGAGLERLARRIEPAVGWDDLVLPPATRTQLTELALRARHREQVLGQWGMRPGGGRGRGVIALFAGESGTGKTMSAEVVARELGMELYVVDLSTVVDKYIGETEKNLERIFVEASDVNGILLFDEADAIFGKRSQVKDAHDKHANVESAYLLQRMESFDGIAVLTTNLRANLDEAFTRRLDVIAEFPMPDAEQRLALWDRCLGTSIPRDPTLDLEFCAARFELAGGSIRACVVTAAYLAAESRAPLTMDQLVTAVLQEYRKLGRLVLESEFGPWLAKERGR